MNELKKRKLKRMVNFSSNETVESKGYENIVEGIEARERFKKMEKLIMKLPVKQRKFL